MIRTAFALFVACSLAAMVAACGGGNKSSAAAAPTSKPAATTASGGATNTGGAGGAASASGTFTLDASFAGGLDGLWSSGNKTGSLSCSVLSNGQLFVTMTGNISNTNYGMGLTQQKYTPGEYTLPSGAQNLPAVQITTSSNSKAEWNLGNGFGSGAITLTGGTGGSDMVGTISGQFADKNGGQAVRVIASFKCKPATG
ncbi:MAG TPA: hypothetical protein VH951_07885 [Dehalococcoidia bacterium]